MATLAPTMWGYISHYIDYDHLHICLCIMAFLHHNISWHLDIISLLYIRISLFIQHYNAGFNMTPLHCMPTYLVLSEVLTHILCLYYIIMQVQVILFSIPASGYRYFDYPDRVSPHDSRTSLLSYFFMSCLCTRDNFSLCLGGATPV